MKNIKNIEIVTRNKISYYIETDDLNEFIGKLNLNCRRFIQIDNVLINKDNIDHINIKKRGNK